MTATGRGDRGQASVELALVLPLVVMVALVVVQIGLVVREQVLVTHAAREAARAAAVAAEGDRVAAAGRGAEHAGPLAADRLSEEVVVDGGSVRVVVHYRASTDVPLVGVLLPDVELGASAEMRIESVVEHGS